MSRGTFWSILITGGGGAALMFAVKLNKKFKKNFFKKICFRFKNTFKSSQHKKVKKKFFSGQNGLPFFGPHRSAFFSIILRLAPVDRKMLSGDLDGFIEKIR